VGAFEELFTVGVTFHSCGCVGPGYIPGTDAELLTFLIEKRAKYVENLRFWLTRKEATTKKEIVREIKETRSYSVQISFQSRPKKEYISPPTAIKYWNERLADLEVKIQYLNNQTKP
jgi:hypothetical protein